MIIPAKPKFEMLRLLALHSYRILDTDAEKEFDQLTQMAAGICETPIALITLLDRDRQWFKSRIGIGIAETSREVSFCAHAILQDGDLHVPDATKDSRFAENPFVTGEAHFRFYHGVPLQDKNGNKIGSLCVLDTSPRQLKSVQIDTLQFLAEQTMMKIELRKQVLEGLPANEEIVAREKFIVDLWDHFATRSRKNRQARGA